MKSQRSSSTKFITNNARLAMESAGETTRSGNQMHKNALLTNPLLQWNQILKQRFMVSNYQGVLVKPIHTKYKVSKTKHAKKHCGSSFLHVRQTIIKHSWSHKGMRHHHVNVEVLHALDTTNQIRRLLY